MSKKRTRAQKIKAQSKNPTFSYPFRVASYDPLGTRVNSYFKNSDSSETPAPTIENKPVITEQYSNLKLIKKDLIKSLIISSFILCLEVVIYLLWYKK